MNPRPSIAAILGLSLVACSPQPKPDSMGSVASPPTVAPKTETTSGTALQPAASASGSSTATVTRMTAEEAASKIKVVTPTERELPEGAREAVLDTLERAVATARGEAGKDPPRVFGVRPDQLLGKLGLENGDRVEALDDRSLATESDAREAFSQAKGKKRFALRLQRRNAPTTLTYTIKE